jgi:putative NADPH-quinone reductase
MMNKKILIINGHPNKNSLSTEICNSYQKGASSVGHEVYVLHLSQISFDPILHQGYKVIQALEPDLIEVTK